MWLFFARNLPPSYWIWILLAHWSRLLPPVYLLLSREKRREHMGRAFPKAHPEAEPSISSELILVQKFKLEDRAEFEHCDCTDPIHAVCKTLSPRKLYDMRYFLTQNFENPMQLSPLQPCELDSSSSNYTSNKRKLLHLYLDLGGAYDQPHNPHQPDSVEYIV